MAKMNVWKRMFPVRTHEGAVAQKVDAKERTPAHGAQLPAWEDTFYEKGNDIAQRIRRVRRREQAGSCGGSRAGARGKWQLRPRRSSSSANWHGRQGRGSVRGGDA